MASGVAPGHAISQGVAAWPSGVVESQGTQNPRVLIVGGLAATSTALTTAQLDDLTLIAAGEGITVKEAIDRYGWNESFSAMVDKIRTDYPREFAGASIEAGKGFEAWINFRDSAPAGVVALVSTFPQPVEIREGKGFTEAQLDAANVRAHFVLWDRRDLVEHVSSEYSISTGSLKIAVEPRAALSQANGETNVRDQLTALLPADVKSVGVTIDVLADLEAQDDTVYGGVALSTCTTGFTVFYGTARWITTAGHCDNSQVYAGRLALGFAGDHQGQWGDFQMHTATEPRADDFYSAPGSLRDVAARGPIPSANQQLCMNGKTTGAHCSYVVTNGFCKDGKCRLTVMATRQAAAGDSGGPWYYGTTAYGIHQGACKLTGIADPVDCFSHVTYIDEALGGVTVATS